jgi:hypothetical protein
MKNKLLKHSIKHRVLLLRSFKAIGSNLVKLFLLDKILNFVPSRFRLLCKALIAFGYKFTFVSTFIGVIYSILAGIFNWSFNYKLIIDLILGLILSLDTGVMSELKILFEYYYTKLFDWWISKIEATDKRKADSLRERLFRSKEKPIENKKWWTSDKQLELHTQSKLQELQEKFDKMKSEKLEQEKWYERMERQTREMKDRNININLTPDYHRSNSWFSFNTIKWLTYALITAGIIYSYYHWLNEINSFFHNQFIFLYTYIKDMFLHPGTFLASLGSYLWLNGKSLIRNYLIRKIWPLSLWFRNNSFDEEDREEEINKPENKQGPDNFPATSMRSLIHTEMPKMSEMSQMPDMNAESRIFDQPKLEEKPLEPNFEDSKAQEDFARMVNHQGNITEEWKAAIADRPSDLSVYFREPSESSITEEEINEGAKAESPISTDNILAGLDQEPSEKARSFWVDNDDISDNNFEGMPKASYTNILNGRVKHFISVMEASNDLDEEQRLVLQILKDPRNFNLKSNFFKLFGQKRGIDNMSSVYDTILQNTINMPTYETAKKSFAEWKKHNISQIID